MEEIRVSEVSYSVYDHPMMEYACDECGARFIDRDENYQYCPHCGRKIVDAAGVDVYAKDVNVPID